MKKAIAIVVLGLFLQGCESPMGQDNNPAKENKNIAIAESEAWPKIDIPSKYRQLPLYPHNKQNEAWNKGEEGNLYHTWRKDYKKMMDEFTFEVTKFCWDNAPKQQGALSVILFVECERKGVSKHIKKHNLYTYATIEAISEYQGKQKAILAPLAYSYEWSNKLANEWLSKRRNITLELYKDLYNAIKNDALSADKEYYAKKKKKKEEGPKIDDNEILAASSGTGFFISKAGHIVTNYHVTENCNPVKVIFKGTEVEAKILAVDKRNDLAIIKANINPDKVYALSNKDVSLMQDVIVAGFPLGKEISSSIKTHKGSVTGLAGFGDNYSNFETSATINPGNSGGPIMDYKGNIVGVAVSTWVEEGVQGIHFGIKSSTLKTFVNANEITFLSASNREMSKEKLAQLVTDATVFLECWMTGAKIKKLMTQKSNRKAFYSKFK